MMPSNAEIIQMHLYEMLVETGQLGNVNWAGAMGYCIGYYDKITNDHVIAILDLQRLGFLK